MAVNMKGKDLISINDLSYEEIIQILDLGSTLKFKQLTGEPHKLLADKTLGMIFAKPSTRTRISFEIGIYQLGGLGLFCGPNDLQFKKSENIKDSAKVMSRFLDGIMIRTFDHSEVKELAEHATIPVINGLTDLLHPCQVLSDLFTIREKKHNFKGLKLAYIGDGNNMCSSLLHGCSKVGIDLSVATPKNYEPNKEIIQNALRNSKIMGSKVEIINDPFAAVSGADIIYTDVWTSMGMEHESEKRKIAFKNFQINTELTGYAKPDYIFMHCLPAHRGDEVVDEIADSEHSVIFDQAENRLHVQKAIMTLLMK